MFLFPPSRWVGGIFYEHVHRLIASCIGFVTVALAIAMWRLERRRWVRLLSYAGVAAVIAQGVLGGLTVLLKLPPAVSVAHALLAQGFFVITIVLAYAESKEFAARDAAGEGSDRLLLSAALSAAGAIFVQLFFGAVMRHTGAGLAVPDFPTAAGSFIPSISAAAIARANELRAQLGIG
jgi:cytochrome c oxidase assembly protein subunit 15